MFKKNPIISIIGMGYVGLPLAIKFSKYFNVNGFDLNLNRINKLNKGIDKNLQFKKKEIKRKNITYSNKQKILKYTDIFIVTVPTPLKKNNKPDLLPIIQATKIIKKYLKKNNIIIYESTVYPGCTEEVCLPLLSGSNKLKLNSDFFIGYSPERINVGDKKHNISNIVKVVSGSNKRTAKYLSTIYGKIVNAGIHVAPSIKVAEAAKVIENSQRDLNIALMNELSKIFFKMGISFNEVIKAASTKWNFIKFKPGLVGGHCIGVDPYYLTYKAKKLGFDPKVLLAGRKTNDYMSKHVADRYHSSIKKLKSKVKKILILGLTFKENCADVRNSKVLDVCKYLQKLNYKVDLYDPNVKKEDLPKFFQKFFVKKLKKNFYQGGLLLVNHDIFIENWQKYKRTFKPNSRIFDINNKLNTSSISLKL